MSKLQSLLNFSNKDGEVITLFGGRVTLSQLLIIIVALIVIFLVLRFLKGTLKLIATVITICYALVHFGIASPEQIKDVSSQIANKGSDFYQGFVDASENIKYENEKILIKTDENEWIDVSSVKSFVSGKDGIVTISTSEGSFTISDTSIIKLLETFK